MDVKIDRNKRLVCIEYPAVVQDEAKMLETVGGEKNVTNTFNDPMRRLELRWRPQDWYCKPTCGDRHPATGLLLRIRRRRRRDDMPGTSNTSSKDLYKVEAVGVVENIFKFHGMADFQYLPMERTGTPDGWHGENGEPSKYHSLLDQLMIKKLEDRSWLSQPATLFLPPPLFSRIDNPFEYAFRDATKHSPSYKNPMKDQPSNLIGIARQRRPHYTVFMNFDEKEVPMKPYPQAVHKLDIKIKDKDIIEKVRQLFIDRPIWSKNGLKAQVPLTGDQFKCCLPVFAYYCVTGPWRSLWVRLGYDPRKDPAAKQFQLVDFRVRQRSAADKLQISAKRSTYAYKLPNTVTKTHLQPTLIQQSMLGDDLSSQSPPPVAKSKDATYKFRPGLVPAYRQMFYQFCDIEEPDIQKLLHSNDGMEVECTEREGWCIPGMQDQARQMISKHLRKFMYKEPASCSDPTEPQPSTSQADLTAGGDMEVEVEGEEEEVEEEEGEEEEGEDNEMETEMIEMQFDLDQADEDLDPGEKDPDG